MIRSLLAGVAVSVMLAVPSLAQTTQPRPKASVQSANQKDAALLHLAWKNFLDAWATGNWAPFSSLIGDEVEFAFPTGPHAGLHTGAQGKAVFLAWIADMQRLGLRIKSTTTSTVIQGNRGVFETSATSVPAGAYRNRESITMEVRNGKIVAFREYWLELDPQAAAKRSKP
jgi:ketosteroid isomerase-like protein